jgi:hypothetical protein
MRSEVKGEKCLNYWNKFIMIGLPEELAKSENAHISPWSLRIKLGR